MDEDVGVRVAFCCCRFGVSVLIDNVLYPVRFGVDADAAVDVVAGAVGVPVPSPFPFLPTASKSFSNCRCNAYDLVTIEGRARV